MLDKSKAEAIQCSKGVDGETDCNKATSIIKGWWSPLYSQGMVVELENGLRFFSNFRYNLK